MQKHVLCMCACVRVCVNVRGTGGAYVRACVRASVHTRVQELGRGTRGVIC